MEGRNNCGCIEHETNYEYRGELVKTCRSDVLTYTCITVGGIATIWRGTAFNCQSQENEILLWHNMRFNTYSRMCNNGTLTGTIIWINNNCYTSQLNVTTGQDINDTTVECINLFTNGSAEIIGSTKILISEGLYPPPDGLHLVDITPEKLTFTWDPVVINNCPASGYNIISSNCGKCPNTTRSATATCTGLQFPSSSELICSLCVQSITRNNFIGQSSDPVIVILKVPDAPEVYIIPHYSANNSLFRLNISINKDDDRISVPVLVYNINYSVQSQICKSISIYSSSCKVSICTSIIDIDNSLNCPNDGDVSVSVNATNIVGSGPTSETVVAQMNQFVHTSFNCELLEIKCLFFDQQNPSCTVNYGQCSPWQMVRHAEGIATSSPTSGVVTVRLNTSAVVDLDAICYIITASNDTYTEIIEGRFECVSSDYLWTLTIPGISSMLLIIITICLTIVIIQTRTKQKDYKPVDDGQFRILKVTHSCELRDFIEKNNIKFKRGSAYYEFTHDFEHISEEQEVIFMEKKTGKLFTSRDFCRDIGAPGKEIKRPKLQLHRVFVQSTKSGARHLDANSIVLYKEIANSSKTDDEEYMFISLVHSNHFKVVDVDTDGTLQVFLKAKAANLSLMVTDYQQNVYLELNHLMESSEVDIINVVLMDVEDTGKLYTGLGAYNMAKKYLKDREEGQKRIFVSSHAINENTQLKAGTRMIFRNAGATKSSSEFQVRKVPESAGCVDMRRFISNCFGSYTNGQAFYEFTRQEEDIYDDTEVVLTSKAEIPEDICTGQDLLYSIPGAPGVGIKPHKELNYRIFIQTKSQGSRCVKPGAIILYRWNPSKPDTVGLNSRVLYSDVSSQVEDKVTTAV